MVDHRYSPRDPRHLGRADNLGFSIVLATSFAIVLGLVFLLPNDIVAPTKDPVAISKIKQSRTPLRL